MQREAVLLDATEDLEDIEISLLLEGVYRHYGYDFRGYSLASLKRRLWRRMRDEGLPTMTMLLDKVLHDTDCMDR